MRFSKIWSMPKGKKEPNENITTTAKREFQEETGIDLEECLHSETKNKTINKTCFYLVEADEMNSKFEGFNYKEVEQVKWVSVRHVINNEYKYSRQTSSVAKYLLNLYL